MIPHLSRAGILTPALLAALFACGSTSPSVLPPDNDLSILFIGNSLTYTNDLPGMVQRLVAAASGETPTVESVAFGDYSLEDHWNQGDALRRSPRGSGTWSCCSRDLRRCRRAGCSWWNT